MNSYHGNNKPYIYVVSCKDEFSDEVIKPLEKNNITLCIGNGFNSKEKKYIEAAYGVLLIINKELISDPDFRKVIDSAVFSNKNILCIYEEEVELDAVLSMQLNPQQAIFAYQHDNKDDLNERILKAVIFHDMKITPEQKRFQRNRSLTMIIAPIIVALVVFASIIYPLMIVPASQEDQIKEQFGLAGLSDEDLAKITSLQIVGNKVFANPEKINKISTNRDPDDPGIILYDVELINNGNWTWGESGRTEVGTIEDISILKKMPNLTRLTIAGENISDISPIFELKKLKELVISDNPIEFLDGIENCISLERIELRGTLVSDLTPLYKLKKLSGIWVGNCRYLTDISGFENTYMNALEICDTRITEIKHLPRSNGFGLSISNIDHFPDFSFLEDPLHYDWLYLDMNIDLLKPHLSKMTVNGLFNFRSANLTRISELEGLTVRGVLELCDCFILDSLDGFASLFPEVTEVSISNCPNINDLSPLLESSIFKLNVDENLAYLVTDEFTEKGIEVEIQR